MRKMKLMTKALAKKTPALRATDGKDPSEIKVTVKIFDPCSTWTWYVTEYDPETGMCFGFVDGTYPELGSFCLNELATVRNKWGLPLERDKWWDENTSLQTVMDNVNR
jgi:hypothetical protein